MQNFLENQFSFTLPNEINLYYCGQRKKTLNHSYGPQIREHFLLMYCVEGRAVLHSDNGDIRFGSNDILVMFPNERIFYEADKDTKWSCWWVGIYGSLVEKFLGIANIQRDYPFIHISDSYTMEMIMKNLYDTSKGTEISQKTKCIGLIYQLFSFLFENTNTVEHKNVVYDAINIIHHNDNNYITVGGISEKLHVNPCYLSRIFKETTGLSPKAYIYDYKIKRAKNLLLQTNISVSEIACSVGLSDPLYFSRIFKKKTKMTPIEYRNKFKEKL